MLLCLNLYTTTNHAPKTYSLRPKMTVLPPGIVYPKMFVEKTFWDIKFYGVGQSSWDGGNIKLESIVCKTTNSQPKDLLKQRINLLTIIKPMCKIHSSSKYEVLWGCL